MKKGHTPFFALLTRLPCPLVDYFLVGFKEQLRYRNSLNRAIFVHLDHMSLWLAQEDRAICFCFKAVCMVHSNKTKAIFMPSS